MLTRHNKRNKIDSSDERYGRACETKKRENSTNHSAQSLTRTGQDQVQKNLVRVHIFESFQMLSLHIIFVSSVILLLSFFSVFGAVSSVSVDAWCSVDDANGFVLNPPHQYFYVNCSGLFNSSNWLSWSIKLDPPTIGVNVIIMPTSIYTAEDNIQQFIDGGWWQSNYQLNDIFSAQERYMPPCDWSYNGGMLWLVQFIGGLQQPANITFTHDWYGPIPAGSVPQLKIRDA